jgi:hypothetical protein
MSKHPSVTHRNLYIFTVTHVQHHSVTHRNLYIFTVTVHVLFFPLKIVCSEPEVILVSCSSNLKAKMQEEGVDKTWKLLVKKVTRARVMSALASREVPEVVKKSWAKYSSRRAARFR